VSEVDEEIHGVGRQGDAYQTERSVIRNEDDVGGQARVAKDRESAARRLKFERR